MNRTGLLASLAVVLLTAACGGDKQEQQPPQNPQPYAGPYGQPGQPGAYPQQPGAYPQQPGAYPQQPGAYPQQPGAYPQPGTDPNQPAQPGQPGQPGALPGLPGLPGTAPQGGGTPTGSAQALDPNLAALATGPMALFANTEAPGMQKEGPVVAGNFQAGQTLESQFTFQPGKCYTLVAQGAGPTIELEMQYVTPLPGLAPSIGKSKPGAQTSIGGKGQCLKPISPFPAQAKFIMKATSGAGVAAAQLYVK